MGICMTELFIELLRVSLGLQGELSVVPSKEQWKQIFMISAKQTLLGVSFSGVEKLPECQRPPYEILSKWIASVVRIEQYNKHLNARVGELAKVCTEHSVKSCLLKGQGVATLYPNPLRRQAGDIDLWVRGSIDETLNAFKTISPLDEICHHHAHCHLFSDTIIEIHFQPSWMYSPITNRRLRKFFAQEETLQFANYNEKLGVNVTDVAFDLVFSAVHIYRHLFTEGIGLRQLLDYYYILTHSTYEQRAEAFSVLSSLQMKKFVSALMFVQQKIFLLPDEFCLTTPNAKVGNFLLDEISIAGNFGQYDSRIRWRNKNILSVFFNKLAHNFRFLKYFPSEVLWAPFWKIWHFLWRRVKGYR